MGWCAAGSDCPGLVDILVRLDGVEGMRVTLATVAYNIVRLDGMEGIRIRLHQDQTASG